MMTTQTSFTIAPAGLPPTAPQRLPIFLHWRWNGVEVAGPEIDTINFLGAAFTLTRGTGDAADTIEMTAT